MIEYNFFFQKSVVKSLTHHFQKLVGEKLMFLVRAVDSLQKVRKRTICYVKK